MSTPHPPLDPEPGGPPTHCGCESAAQHHGYSADKDAYLKRLARLEGQIRGIARMVDSDTYCIDVLTQIASVNKSLHSLSLQLLKDHIGHCVIGAAPAEQEAKVAEATAAIGRLLR